MFNSIAFDVVIGLVFVYMLYSLLATVLSEIIATWLGLRARNLKEAVNRMLNDEQVRGFWRRLWDSLKLMKNPKNPVIKNFYNHPDINYLGSSGLFRNPSSFKAVSFSKTLLNLMFGDVMLTREIINQRMEEIIGNANGPDKILDPDTARYINNLWNESYGDIVKFKHHLENWFDRTMEQATEWYKRKIQIVLLFLGFFIAWSFNADTFSIIGTLSTDKDARDKMVSMASAYVQQNKTLIDTTKIKSRTELKTFNDKLDSLLDVKKTLDADIAKANNVLGMGCWPPDVVHVKFDQKKRKRIFTPVIDSAALNKRHSKIRDGKLEFTARNKWGYFFRLFPIHFFGYLLTAIAISLGAPFWFDLLNKLMKLRTSEKVESASSGKSAGGAVTPINREG